MPMCNLSESTRIFLTQPVDYGFIPKMKHPVLVMILQMTIILNLLSIRLNCYKRQLQM